MLSPIVIFAFNRPDLLSNLIRSLKVNPLYEESDKYIFIDGCRDERDKENVARTIEIALNVTNNVIISEKNKGLGVSVISGVSEIISQYGRAIVLEDDLFCAPGFLLYMNNGLDCFEKDKRVISICGYGLKIRKPKDYKLDVYFSDRSSSWGWATWKDRWDSIDWAVEDWEQLKSNRKMQRQFNRAGSDMFSMLRDYMLGRNKSWAIRFCYAQFRQGKYSVHPFRSLVENDGFGIQATNCQQKYSRFKVDLDLRQSKGVWQMGERIEVHEKILCQLHAYHSVIRRIYSKFRKIINI